MSGFDDDPGRGFRHPRIAVSDPRIGAVIDLPEPVAVALLESDPDVRRAYEKHFKMAGQWMVPPQQRQGRLILIDPEIIQRVLAELPAEVVSELRAEFPDDEDEPEQEKCPPAAPPPHEQLPLDCHLKTLMGDRYDPESPTFISPVRPASRPARG